MYIHCHIYVRGVCGMSMYIFWFPIHYGTKVHQVTLWIFNQLHLTVASYSIHSFPPKYLIPCQWCLQILYLTSKIAIKYSIIMNILVHTSLQTYVKLFFTGRDMAEFLAHFYMQFDFEMLNGSLAWVCHSTLLPARPGHPFCLKFPPMLYFIWISKHLIVVGIFLLLVTSGHLSQCFLFGLPFRSRLNKASFSLKTTMPYLWNQVNVTLRDTRNSNDVVKLRTLR